jgi:hypothetical protein|tara:strand:- start:763 stop:1620 length:858 start_codon:yes stop_codon:yes gene_type:complete
MTYSKPIALALSGLFIFISWSSIWFEISAVGVYSEGIDREPTITTDYIIDNNRESFELSIENSTPLLLYWINRENISPDQVESDNSSSNPNIENSISESESCSGSCLELVRNIVKLTMCMMFLFLSLSILKPIRWIKISTMSTWIIGVLIILIAVPLAIAVDFGIFEVDNENKKSTTGGFDTSAGETVGYDQFAHFDEDNSIDFSLKGIHFSYESIGFDLGLVNEEDRENLTEKAPQEGEPGYDSLIAFDGELNIGPGHLINWWLLISPLLLLILFDKREFFEEE